MATRARPGPESAKPATVEATSATEPLRRVGQSLVALGALVVLFACYQLWGTGLLEWQAQRQLSAELAAKLSVQQVDNWSVRGPVAEPADPRPPEATGGTTEMGASSKPAPAAPMPVAPAPTEGNVLGRLEIPSIGVSKAVLQGVGRHTLRQGPGHYPSTALPGRLGNVAIAGHRTTHGAPFFDLDLVEPGDEITVETLNGVFTYEVQAQEGPDGTERGHVIVDPAAVEVIGDHGDNRLTLTACHPKFSARQRIVVSALLVDGPEFDRGPTIDPGSTAESTAESTAGPAKVDQAAGSVTVRRLAAEETTLFEPADLEATTIGESSTALPHAQADVEEGLKDSLGWQSGQLDPTVLWATVLLLVAHGGWVAGRLWRPAPAYLVTAPVAVVPLFLFYLHLDRLLPAF